MDYTKETIRKTCELFEKRFKSPISFEMKTGYFWEWCDRIQNKNPFQYADDETAKVLREILN